MKKRLVLVALGTVIAAPAFAQHDPNDPNDPRRVRSLYQQQSSTIPSGDIYYGRNGNANPDFQPGSSRWKANPKSKHARHHISVSQK
jgi:hypothetical protein